MWEPKYLSNHRITWFPFKQPPGSVVHFKITKFRKRDAYGSSLDQVSTFGSTSSDKWPRLLCRRRWPFVFWGSCEELGRPRGTSSAFTQSSQSNVIVPFPETQNSVPFYGPQETLLCVIVMDLSIITSRKVLECREFCLSFIYSPLNLLGTGP